MRLLIFALTLLFCSSFSIAQTLQNENEIVEYLGQSKFDQLSQSNPSYLKFLDAKCSFGFEIESMGSEKTSGFETLNTIKFNDPDNKITKTPSTITASQFVQMYEDGSLNILMYEIVGDKSAMTYYVLGNTGKVLMVFPVDYIAQKVNQ